MITRIPKTYLVSNSKIEEFGLGKTKTLIENRLEGSLNSGRLLQQLLQKCHDLKVEFLFGTEVLKIHESELSVKISIKNIDLEAEKIVIATNAFTKKFSTN